MGSEILLSEQIPWPRKRVPPSPNNEKTTAHPLSQVYYTQTNLFAVEIILIKILLNAFPEIWMHPSDSKHRTQGRGSQSPWPLCSHVTVLGTCASAPTPSSPDPSVLFLYISTLLFPIFPVFSSDPNSYFSYPPASSSLHSLAPSSFPPVSSLLYSSPPLLILYHLLSPLMSSAPRQGLKVCDSDYHYHKPSTVVFFSRTGFLCDFRSCPRTSSYSPGWP